ncbi:MAG: hypothetical protein OET44_13345 [Gammaproteobacteria bacterium]|nr:hypothetical protein [Gammaproteobacteria bacterium]
MQQVYDIVFTGRLRPGTDPEQVLDSFGKRFDVGPDTARAMLHAEQEIVIRKSVPANQAYKFKEVLESFGMEVRLQALHEHLESEEPSLELVPKGGAAAPDEPAEEKGSMHLHRTGVECPKCGTRQPAARACVKCGVIFAKYYEHAAKPSSGGESARIARAREAARKTAARRRNSTLINVVLAIAVLCIVGGLSYVYYSGHQF